MTIGPMTCQVCRGRVWWRDRALVMPYLGRWRKHNCKSVLDGREANPRTVDRAAYKREWKRLRKAAAYGAAVRWARAGLGLDDD